MWRAVFSYVEGYHDFYYSLILRLIESAEATHNFCYYSLN